MLCTGILWLRCAGASLRCGARISHCGGFSCCGAQTVGAWASVVVARGLSSCGSRAVDHRLRSFGIPAQWLRCVWDLPGPAIEPMSAALAGGFLTTAPPGKPRILFFNSSQIFSISCYLSNELNCGSPKKTCSHPNPQNL